MSQAVIDAAVRLRECHNGAGPSVAYIGHPNWREAADADAATLARDYLNVIGGDKDMQASAWMAVYSELKQLGLEEFVGHDNSLSGRARAMQFIQYLATKARGDGRPVVWDDKTTYELNANQHDGARHPYTCGNDSRHRPLIATRFGWKCADCGYIQNWAHDVPPFGRVQSLRTFPEPS